MKKIFTAIVASILFGTVASAQQANVTGIVLDSLSREGEPAAILQFFKAPDYDKPVAFTTTDNDGKFSQALSEKGEYRLVFNNMGRKSVTRNFTLDGTAPSLDLGTILVQDDIRTLDAGTVVAQRPLVRMEVDRMTYDVANDVDSRTSTVLDMLRKVPMVSVDGQDNITVNGSSSFVVYVDGKPNQMIASNPSVVFKMMPASAVKDISVVTNPGVRYDAEGVGGVLQITTNREVTGGASAAEGAYGTLTAQASTRGGGAGVFYNQQKGKFAISLTGNAMLNNSPGTTIDIERTTTAGMTTSMHSEGTMKNPIALGNLNLSYEIDSLNLVSATAGLMRLGTISDNTGLTTMGFGGTGFSYTSGTWSKGNTASVTASADYQHLWAGSPNRSFVLSYQFSASPTVTESKNTFGRTDNPLLDLTDRRTDGKTNSLDHTVQADFTTPVDGIGTLSTGAKFISRHNFSDQMNYLWNGSGWDHNKAGSTKYDYFNRIGAAYTEMAVNLGTVGIKAGARYEYTWQDYSQDGGSTFKTSYGCLVPTASVQLNLGMTSNIGLSYNMRISRPGITYLNPYRDDSDPTALSYGNPDLEVEKAHNVSLVYNYFSTKLMLNLTARYGYTGNGISPYSFYEGNILHSTFGNIVKSSSAGLNAFVMVNAGAKTRIILNGSADYSDLRSDVLDQKNSGWSGTGLVGFQQTLPWDLRFSANAILMSRTKDLQGWSTGISLGTLGLTKTFLDDRLSVSLSAVSPLGSGSLAIKSHSETRDFISDMSMAVPIRQASLSVSWTFGKQGNYGVKKARRTITNDDVINTQSTAETLNGSGALGGSGTSTSLPAGM